MGEARRSIRGGTPVICDLARLSVIAYGKGMTTPDRPREWDAGAYHDLATPHQAWGAAILDRLPLHGDETVLDLGCGTGRVTAQLLQRLGPNGHVIGIDGSAQMVDDATRRLGEDPRASF